MESKLPKNWVETKLNELVLSKKGKKPKVLNEVEFEGSVPYLDIKAFEKNEIRRYADVESSNLIKETEIGIVWDGARSGWVSKGKKGAVGSTIAIIKPINTNSDFLYRFLQSKFEYLNSNTRGTGIPHVDPKILWSIDFPLPPLAEQQRIVAKLDTLFGSLDALKIRLNNIPQLIKNFKQAVLTQAVTGKLTQEWRVGKELEDVNTVVKEFLTDLVEKEKSLTKKKKIKALIKEKSFKEFKIPEEWTFFKLDKLCLEFTYGSSSKSLNEGLVPVLRMGNLQDGKIDWKKLKYSIDEKEIKKYLLSKGDVLFNRTNSPELVGKTSLYSGEKKALYAGYLIKIKNGEVLNSSYLNYVLNSPYAKEWSWKVKTDGVSQSNINAQKLSQFNLPFPPKEEQTEIVKRVENLFSKADAIENQYKTLKEKIDRLPQAILAKAFKGELVAQLPTDGDAKDLLEEIKKLKESLVVKPKKKVVRNKK
ncbi:restriction endonuclease subunit S [Tenacibaculum finnmarkense genomovar ulcerans]|uniref:restriction endonuclease subunit S n=1 Tax=Tenacibaculum finnmarkense TaxID=2781243 RepID=UPI001E284175|nr:restriction endonuclease subunit S [Tenacibaculum finnmarkense]MCD8453784.1 restriction endonuclease subunit S [Tenacibaculum finnmarkense genomovar ulcerans]